nr:E3 ubiquitin-protein ligase AIP2 [Ipomoea batatas]
MISLKSPITAHGRDERRLKSLRRQFDLPVMFQLRRTSVLSILSDQSPLRSTCKTTNHHRAPFAYHTRALVACGLTCLYIECLFYEKNLNRRLENKKWVKAPAGGRRWKPKDSWGRSNLSRKLLFSSDSIFSGFLFEGHLTVDPEPPQPDWLVMSNLLSAAATLPDGQSSEENPASSNSSEAAANLLRELADRLDDIVPMILDDAPAAPRVPPASKEVVAKLPVTTVTDEFLAKLDADAECAICKENLVLNDKMQELPCKHMFHPPCLKPWLDEHNSCPICRHELQTDDHNYESWKEREREAEEERKGAANAVREGEYMYV